MVMPGVVRFVPGPQEAVHHIFMRPVGHIFPEKKCADGDEGTEKVAHSGSKVISQKEEGQKFFVELLVLSLKGSTMFCC